MNPMTAILVMAGVTYLIRMLPLVIFRKEIQSVWVRSFLYYVPYAVLGTMTIPAIFTSTANLTSGVIGCLVAAYFAYKEKDMVVVAIVAVVSVYMVELLLSFF